MKRKEQSFVCLVGLLLLAFCLPAENLYAQKMNPAQTAAEQAEIAPLEAVKAATVVPAQVFNLKKNSGTIEKGKFADLVLIEGNPLENISEIRNVKFVIKDGRMFESARLWQSVGFKP
jgi:imidazolonepropionase-like amidohydrolase